MPARTVDGMTAPLGTVICDDCAATAVGVDAVAPTTGTAAALRVIRAPTAAAPATKPPESKPRRETVLGEVIN